MSIFNEENKMKHPHFQTITIGDSLEGTYVKKRIIPNTNKPGEMQNLYIIKKTDGEFMDVYGKPGIDAQMEDVTLGQIVGFKYTAENPSANPKFNPTKVVDVFSNKETVDQVWVDANKDLIEAEAISQSTPVPASVSTPTPAPVSGISFVDVNTPVTPDLGPVGSVEATIAAKTTEELFPSTDTVTPTTTPPTQEEAIAEINKIATDKLGATTPEEVKTKAMEATGLAFIPSNVNNILVELKKL